MNIADELAALARGDVSNTQHYESVLRRAVEALRAAERLTEQRDALLAAVRDVALAAHSQHIEGFDHCYERSCLKARAAIAAAEEK